MPALIAHTHNSEVVAAGLPQQLRLVATNFRNRGELSALAASMHNFRVLTTVLGPLLSAVNIPATQHYVELFPGTPRVTMTQEDFVVHLLEVTAMLLPHPHSRHHFGAMSNPHPQAG